MNPKDYIEIILGLAALIGIIYKIAQAEATIHTKINRLESSVYTAIDNLKDTLSERLTKSDYVLNERLMKAEHKLDIHLTEYAEKKTFFEYRINGNEKLIEHKFNRLKYWIDQIAGYLSKGSNFKIRDDQY
ncbi:MAG: hypothetical protein SAK29_31675 [Scytonema sp. PMC 1069.18]|nr:hypothetical protein [Scytonema sp. PMC 1069.18]MEC4888291.1 hypothetical protein [Scytonema sp. PMC 1070.18]